MFKSNNKYHSGVFMVNFQRISHLICVVNSNTCRLSFVCKKNYGSNVIALLLKINSTDYITNSFLKLGCKFSQKVVIK